jgi:hypothetical protein
MGRVIATFLMTLSAGAATASGGRKTPATTSSSAPGNPGGGEHDPERLPGRVSVGPADLPSPVSITVTVAPTARAHRIQMIRARMARRRRWLSAGVAVAAVTSVALPAVLGLPGDRTMQRDRTIQRDRTNHLARAAAPSPWSADAAAVAAAFGYPRRCLRIAISAADPDYATAHVDRTGTCGAYRGYLNASLHRVGGVWRLVLDEGQLFVPNALLSPGAGRSTTGGATPGSSLGCVSIGVAFHDPRFGQAAFDRTLSCGRAR